MSQNTGPAVVVSGTSNTAGETETTLTDNGINRDIDNTTVTGNEVTTGALEVDITVDVAALVNAVDNIKNLPENLKGAAIGAAADIASAVNSAKDIANIALNGANYVISGIQNISKENAVQLGAQTAKVDEIISQTGKAPSIEEQLTMQGITDPEEQKKLIVQVAYQVNGETREELRIFKNGKENIVRGTDDYGCGDTDCKRADRTHNATDINSKAGEGLIAPTNGIIVDMSPYTSNDNYTKVPGVAFAQDDGTVILLFYVSRDERVKARTQVTKGQPIGKAFDIEGWYKNKEQIDKVNGKESANPNKVMTNHIHVEIRKYESQKTFLNRNKSTSYQVKNPYEYFNNIIKQ